MNNRLLCFIAIVFVVLSTSSCKLISGKGKSGTMPNDGQLHGVAPGKAYNLTKPTGMVYVPAGTFHMGPSDEDVNYAYTARNKQVSISGFWMDATEITNNEYREFTNWVRDSIAAKLMGFVKQGSDGIEYVDWKKASAIKYGDKATFEKGLEFSAGIEYVMVNGSFILKNGKTVSNIFPGQAVYGKFKK